jgi:hypothetical protein
MNSGWSLYRQKVEEYVKENELYISKYTDRPSNEETPDQFKFRVWQVTLSGGAKRAHKPEYEFCFAKLLF